MSAPGAVRTGTVTLRAYLQGATDLAPGIDHHAHVWVNGVKVGDVAWDGIAPTVLTATFDAGLLAAGGSNVVRVTGALDSGVAYSVSGAGLRPRLPAYLPGERRPVAFRGAGNPVVTVGGFSGSTSRCWT